MTVSPPARLQPLAGAALRRCSLQSEPLHTGISCRVVALFFLTPLSNRRGQPPDRGRAPGLEPALRRAERHVLHQRHPSLGGGRRRLSEPGDPHGQLQADRAARALSRAAPSAPRPPRGCKLTRWLPWPQVGNPGDHRFVTWPAPDTVEHAFGSSGGGRQEAGTDHCRAPSGHTEAFRTETVDWLFDLSKDCPGPPGAVKNP